MNEHAQRNKELSGNFKRLLHDHIVAKCIEFEEQTGMTVERISMNVKKANRADGIEIAIGREFDFTITI